jgi:hypothetical protein
MSIGLVVGRGIDRDPTLSLVLEALSSVPRMNEEQREAAIQQFAAPHTSIGE